MKPADLRSLERVRVEIRRQVGEMFVDGVHAASDGHVMPDVLDLAAVAMRADVSLEDLARVADRLLAWDSQAFVNACGVRSHDIRAEDVTRAGHARLTRLNGGRPLRYSLSGWST